MNWIFPLIRWSGFALLTLLIACNSWIYFSTRSDVDVPLEGLPNKKVALVLGTSKSRVSGEPNGFFTYRMEAVAELFKSGKVQHVLVSGDNRSKYYNEPRDMKEALIELGVPDSAITEDFAGLRTLDSVVRCKVIFGQDDIILVTQKFHLYRALFIAAYYDIEAIGYTAETPEVGSMKVFFRELIARPLAVFDLYFLNMQPKHLGETIELDI